MTPFLRSISRKNARLHAGLIAIVVLLCFTGFALLYDAAGGSFYPYAYKQAVRFVVGLGLMWAIAVTDIRVWFKYAYILYLLAVVLLVAVYVNGHTGMGAQRWLDLKVFLLQPSELAKVFIILALARFYHRTSFWSLNQFQNVLIPSMMIGLMVGLVVVQPDLGTAIVLAAIGVAIMFVCGLDKKFFIFGISSVLAAIPVLWHFVMHDYQKKRVTVFLNPEADPLGAGYHIMQSNIAIGSSDFFGKGFLQGTQSHLEFLPEKHTDFIFTLLVEDFGMFGAIILLFCYMLFLGFGFHIVSRTKSLFGKAMAVGVIVMVFLHAVINMAMVMGLMPVVGIPLPFISYGGTSMMTMMIAVGFLLNAYVHREEELKSLR